MNVNGKRIKDEVIAGIRAFMESRRDGFNSDDVERELIKLLRAAGQPGSLAIGMTGRFLEEERVRGWIAITGRDGAGRHKRNVWKVTWDGLHRGAKDRT